ncbi:MAG: hypothetical protein AB1656_15435 [Candidatus Omnitrophota bacterium]
MWNLSLLIQKHLLQIVESKHGALDGLRRRLHEGETQLLSPIIDTIDRHYDDAVKKIGKLPESLLKAVYQPEFRLRTIQTVIEAANSEPLSPPLAIIPRRDDAPPIPPFPVFAILVEQLPHALNEVYPLMVDSYVYDLETQGARRRNVVCSHISWLGGDFRLWRGMIWLEDRDNPIEMEFDPPLAMEGALFLCMTPETHKDYSARCKDMGIAQINAYEEVEKADDKYACYRAWNSAGVPTPEAALVSRGGDGKDLPSKLKSAFYELFPQEKDERIVLIMQPNRGTEGRGVRAFEGPPDWEGLLALHADLLDHARTIAKVDDIIIRRGVGNVFYRQENGEDAYFDLRMNVVEGKSESGFLMAARPPSFISSPGQGGRIIEWKRREVFPLIAEGRSHPLTMGSDEWKMIEAVAEEALSALPRCKIAGIDLRLEWRNEKPEWKPWVLDINPRPAGLAHSRFTDTGEPGVTRRLWNRLIVERDKG